MYLYNSSFHLFLRFIGGLRFCPLRGWLLSQSLIEALLGDAKQIARSPIKGQTAGKLEADESDEERHHHHHSPLHRLGCRRHHPLLDEIRQVDLNQLTPLEALTHIKKWQDELAGE